jgi:tetratricopeptide (TPR) repeat protein
MIADTALPTSFEPATSSHIPQGDNEGTMSTSQIDGNESTPISAALTQKSGIRSRTPSAAHTAQPTRVPAPPTASLPLLVFKPQVNNISTQLANAYLAYRAGNMITAEELYQAILQQDTKNRDALLGMAAIAQQQQNDGLAIQYYSQVLALDPRDPAAYAAMSTLNLSDPSSAESHLKLLIPHRPHAGILYFALGNVYAGQLRWGDAQQAYFNAVNREMENAQFNFNLAVSLDHLGQNQLSAQYYQRALQLDQTGAASFNHAAAQQRLQKLAPP